MVLASGRIACAQAVRDSLRLDTVSVDSMQERTLNEVRVRGEKHLPVEGAIDKSLKRMPKTLRIPSFGEIIEKLSPGINDKITHPFAVKQRKRERRKLKHQKILREYDRVKTFNELLQEAVMQQQLEDSLAKVREAQKE